VSPTKYSPGSEATTLGQFTPLQRRAASQKAQRAVGCAIPLVQEALMGPSQKVEALAIAPDEPRGHREGEQILRPQRRPAIRLGEPGVCLSPRLAPEQLPAPFE
jgi:hypothetical protein